MLSRDWVRVDDATTKLLKRFSRNLAPKVSGMTRKNRTRLHQFDDPKQLKAFMELPANMMKEACEAPAHKADEARIAQMAVLIELLLMAPLRIKNISELEIDKTLFLTGTTSGYILIDAAQVKNKDNIEIPLPQSLLGMIDIYLKRFHPMLAPPGCRFLFPSCDSGHKRSSGLSNQLAKCLSRRCGILMNAHLFRHLAAKVYLEAFPGAYGIIRMLLGHKSIDTTTNSYCGTENAAAFRAWDAHIIDLRGGTHPTPQARFAKSVS